MLGVSQTIQKSLLRLTKETVGPQERGAMLSCLVPSTGWSKMAANLHPEEELVSTLP